MPETVQPTFPRNPRDYMRVLGKDEVLQDSGVMPGFKNRRMYTDEHGNMFFEIEQYKDAGANQYFASMLLKPLGAADVVFSEKLGKYLSYGHPLPGGRKDTRAYEHALIEANATAALVSALFDDSDRGVTTEGKKRRRIIENIHIGAKGDFYIYDFWDMGQFFSVDTVATEWESEVTRCMAKVRDKAGTVLHYASKNDSTPSEETAHPHREEILRALKRQFQLFQNTYTSTGGLALFKSQYQRAYTAQDKRRLEAAQIYAMILWRCDVLTEALHRMEQLQQGVRWSQ